MAIYNLSIDIRLDVSINVIIVRRSPWVEKKEEYIYLK